MPTPSLPGLVAFLAVVAFVLAAAVLAVARAFPARPVRAAGVAAAVLAAWLALTAAPPALGLITPERAVPGAPLFMVALLGTGVAVVVSPLGGRLAAAVPVGALVAFQGFRLPLELVLHRWADEGVAPPQMTWTGANVDIVAGVASLLLAPLAARSRAAAWLAEAIGVVLLLNVLRVVVGSLPTPLQRWPDPLLLPFAVPTIWIGSVCVVGALVGHGLLARRLLADRAAP